MKFTSHDSNSADLWTNKIESLIKTKSQNMSIVLTAGGTGGHFFPSIATGEELIGRGYKVHLITDPRCQKYCTKDLKLILHIINLKSYSKGVLAKIQFFIYLLVAIFKTTILLRAIKPNVLVGFGGYPTFPAMCASIILRIPIVIHESNYCIGKVNKLFLRFAKKIAFTYKETRDHNILDKNKTLITGNIVRANIRCLKVKDNFYNDIFRIFIFGGSQGAKIFSNLIPGSIKILVESHPEIKLHITQQASQADQVEIGKIYSTLNITYQLSEFFYDIAQQYEKQELVIARSGASTIAELTYIGLPAIFIPLPSAAKNHQFYNAKALENSGAGWCFEQDQLSLKKLADKILVLIKNPDILKQASDNLLQRRNDGSKILANIIEQIIY